MLFRHMETYPIRRTPTVSTWCANEFKTFSWIERVGGIERNVLFDILTYWGVCLISLRLPGLISA